MVVEVVLGRWWWGGGGVILPGQGGQSWVNHRTGNIRPDLSSGEKHRTLVLSTDY